MFAQGEAVLLNTNQIDSEGFALTQGEKDTIDKYSGYSHRIERIEEGFVYCYVIVFPNEREISFKEEELQKVGE